MQVAINKFLEDLAKHPRWTNFKTEIKKKLNNDFKRLKGSGQSTWETAERGYSQIIKTLSLAQKQVDLEVQKTLKSIKKSAAEVEKTLAQYKKMATKQKAQVKKSRPVKRKATAAAKPVAKRSTEKRTAAKNA